MVGRGPILGVRTSSIGKCVTFCPPQRVLLSRGDEYGSGWIPSTPPRHSSLPWGNALPREPVVGISNGVGRPPAPPAAFLAAVPLLSRPVTVVVFPTHRPTALSVHFRVVVAPHRAAALIPGPLPRG